MTTKNNQLKTAKDTLFVCIVLIAIIFSDYVWELIERYILN